MAGSSKKRGNEYGNYNGTSDVYIGDSWRTDQCDRFMRASGTF